MRRWSNIVRAVAMVVISTVITGLAYAQVEVPFTAKISAERVPLYAGAGHTFYTVGELEAHSTVTVEEIIFGWYKIASPPGTSSYVETGLIEPSQDGRTGVVRARRAAVKAASLDGPTQSYRRQLDLLKGDTVRILATKGQYYEIASPRGAYLFLPPNSLRMVDRDESEAGRVNASPSLSPAPKATDPVPAYSPAPNPSPANIDKEIASPPDAAHDSLGDIDGSFGETSVTYSSGRRSGMDEDMADPSFGITIGSESQTLVISSSVQKLEQRFRGAMRLPIEQQPINELIDEYRGLAGRTQLNASDRQIISRRLKQLQRQSDLKSGLAMVADAKDDHASGAHATDAGLVTPVRYAAIGTLTTSTIYDGQRLPRLYRVIDRSTDRTIAYIRPNEQVNFGEYLSKRVGLVGRSNLDPDLQLQIVEVERIDIQDDGSGTAGAIRTTE